MFEPTDQFANRIIVQNVNITWSPRHHASEQQEISEDRTFFLIAFLHTRVGIRKQLVVLLNLRIVFGVPCELWSNIRKTIKATPSKSVSLISYF
jgi:hypothetical protein